MSFTCSKLKISSPSKKLVDISFSFESSFALVGESGSGKSLSLKALLGMLPNELEVELDIDREVYKRGKSIAFVPQNPFTALSPLTKIIDQFLISRDKAKEYFELVGLKSEFLDRFPSELSGGQLQRVVIAFALALEPKLLLLDEPTTALDVDSKNSILKLLKALHVEKKFYMLFVTHDIDSTKDLCKEIAILKNGKIIESGLLQEVINNPKEDYTKKLLSSSFKNREFRQ
ncbi:ATP-binding cassette domain-containing protein [Sulfurospirillum sp. 1307]